MKEAIFLIIGIGMLCQSQIGLGETISNMTAVPQNITQFYADWNFAACYSTPSERSKLRYIHDVDKDKGLLSKRLKSVAKRLNNIEARIHKCDPGMVRNMGVRPPVTADYIEVIDIENEGDNLSIRVKAWSLSVIDNAVFVTSYEEAQGKSRDRLFILDNDFILR